MPNSAWTAGFVSKSNSYKAWIGSEEAKQTNRGIWSDAKSSFILTRQRPQTDKQCVALVPPQPYGRTGLVVQPASCCRPSQQNVAAELCVESRRGCRVSTSSSLLDLDSQDPFAIGTLFRNRSSSYHPNAILRWRLSGWPSRLGRVTQPFPRPASVQPHSSKSEDPMGRPDRAGELYSRRVGWRHRVPD